MSRAECAQNQTQVATYDIKRPDVKRQTARFFAALSDLRVARLKNGDIAFAVFGPVGVNNELRNETNYTQRNHTGWVYDTDDVREVRDPSLIDAPMATSSL